MGDKSIVAVDQSVIRLPDGTTIPLISPEAELMDDDGDVIVYYDGHAVTPLGRKRSLPDHYVHEEPGYTVGRCKMITRAGNRCRNGCRDGWTVCHKHGAGRPDNPGGLSSWHIEQGRYSAALPERLVERYDEFLANPDTVSMGDEMALVDVRIAELLGRLDTADTDVAWSKVRLALRRIDKIELDGDDIDFAVGMLETALEAQRADEAAWGEIMRLVEQRRRLAETERRRIVEAKQFMTVEEAHRFMAYVLGLIQEHVSSAQEKRAIADGLRRFM